MTYFFFHKHLNPIIHHEIGVKESHKLSILELLFRIQQMGCLTVMLSGTRQIEHYKFVQ